MASIALGSSKRHFAIAAHPALQQGETEWVGNSAPDRVLTFLRHGAGEECFVAIYVSNQPYAGVADAPAGEHVDETPGLDDAAGKKVSLPAFVLKAWDFRIYCKVH